MVGTGWINVQAWAMRRMARAYLRGFPEKLRGEIPVRFDVMSVYLLPSGVEFDLYRGAIGW